MTVIGNRFSNRAGAEETNRKQVDLLRAAGLDEQQLRAMAPDDRVAALERAGLDPYDFIFLAY